MATPTARRIVGVSTKMYFSAARTRQYVDEVVKLISASHPGSNVDIFIIPDLLTVSSTLDQLRGTGIWCGVQDASDKDEGAFTGEVSPAVAAELGCRLVEVGHAERRRLFGETDESTARKAAAAARNGLIPLVCIGEKTADSKEAIVECYSQVEPVLAAVPDEAEVVLAYEPVWAIGAAQPAGVDYVVSVANAIRGFDCVQKRKGTTRIIYGGSAGPGLFAGLKDGLDGMFLGRFAHEPQQFYKTIQEIAEA
ncbi:hypothetical protein VUR80DRAFT_3578 [Thermomyces stellatus]